jgi:hypothetical protein
VCDVISECTSQRVQHGEHLDRAALVRPHVASRSLEAEDICATLLSLCHRTADCPEHVVRLCVGQEQGLCVWGAHAGLARNNAGSILENRSIYGDARRKALRDDESVCSQTRWPLFRVESDWESEGVLSDGACMKRQGELQGAVWVDGHLVSAPL